MTDELAELDATATAALVRGGEVTAAEAGRRRPGRIEAVDPQLHALVRTRFEQAAEAAADAGRQPSGRGPRRRPARSPACRSC